MSQADEYAYRTVEGVGISGNVCDFWIPIERGLLNLNWDDQTDEPILSLTQKGRLALQTGTFYQH